MSDGKRYVSATVAAAKIGVPRDAVVADIERGNRGEDAFALAGDRQGDWWLVESYEVECDRLAMHKNRLTGNSADAGLRQLQRESEDLGLYGPQSAHQHWPGQVQFDWCKGTGAIDAPTSADDPTCPNCDGEGRWAKLQT